MEATGPTSYRFGSFRLDPQERLLHRDGEPVALTPKAFDTLVVLVERHGRLITKDDLLREVWPDVVVEENNLAQHISMLRRALGQSEGSAPFIETVPKRGYRFVAPVIVESPRDVTHPAAHGVPPPESGALNPSPVSRAVTTGRPRGRWAVIWGAIGVAVVGAAWIGSTTWANHRKQRPPAAISASESGAVRVAVLPFVNLGAPEGDYLAGGTTEELTSRLARDGHVRVVSSTSTREYDRHGKTIRQIGADLGAAYVVEGSIGRDVSDPNRLRIIPKLIRVADDATVWTEQYDTPLSGMEDVHAAIAGRVASLLSTDPDAHREPGPRVTADAEAYLAYLRGIAAYQQAWSDTALQARARRELEDAVARDPNFALAWSWLAHVYATQHNTGAERTAAVREAAYRAARTAIRLSPALPDAHLGLARVLMTNGDYDGALREIAVAQGARPDLPDAVRMEALVRQRRGEWAESLARFMHAFELDPAATSDQLAVYYLHLRDYARARTFIDVGKAANHSGVVVPEAWLAFSERGDIQAARAVLEAALAQPGPADARVRGLLARFEWFDGRYDRALRIIDDMDPAGAWLPANFRMPASIARGQVYDSMGQRSRAREQYLLALAELNRREPSDYQVLAAKGLAAAGLRRQAEAVRWASRAVELLPTTRNATEGPVYVYLLALVQARCGLHAEALRTLDRMFQAPGFYSEVWIDRDPWFASLRSDAAFAEHRRRWSTQKGEALLARR